MAVNPESLATACPYCMMMFEDATGTKGVADTLPIQDVAELIEAPLATAQGAGRGVYARTYGFSRCALVGCL